MNEILAFLDGLNKYSSLILMFATLVYVYFTYKLTKETTKLRKVETTPFISLYFDITFPSVNHSKIIIKNIGKAPAYNISFKVDKKYIKLFNGYTFKNNISYFAPNQEFHILAEGFGKLNEKGYDNIPITVNYQSHDKRVISDTFNLEWKYLAYYEKDNIEGIKNALENIKKEVAILNKTIKDKNYQVTTKLKILELEKTYMYLKFIFSNGYLGKVHNSEINKLGISDIKQTYIDNGDLTDYSINIKLTAEEIYNKLIHFKTIK